ncbi:MAG: hypothetical protein WB660_08315 [Candidatus Sulfotelmatobacter sp.]
MLPVGGCAVLPVGGRPVLPVGGAGGDAWPGAPDPAGGAPPAGAACATTQVAQNRSTASNAIFLDNMMRPPALISLAIPIPAGGVRWVRESIKLSLSVEAPWEYPADAVSGDEGIW